MASSSKSPKQPKFAETTQDMISSVPTEVTDKIMKRLPLKTAAKMSVLSRKWRRNWLSHRYLVFDRDFWKEQRKNGKIEWHKISVIIISNILFLHNGPVQVFHLHIPDGSGDNISLNLSPWIFFLSRIGVKKISITNWSNRLIIPSHIYACKELVKLRIEDYVIQIPPCEFKGFAHLRNLELVDVEFKHETLKSLIASCPQLKVLVLENNSTGMNNVVIDAPRLEALTIRCAFKSLALENVPCVKSVIVCLQSDLEEDMEEDFSDIEIVDAIKVLASSTKLQCLQFEGLMCELLAAAYIAQPFTLAFNHLHRLCLIELELRSFRIFSFTFSMLQSCPFIKDLHISLNSIQDNVQHKFDYNEDYKLGHLLKVRITVLLKVFRFKLNNLSTLTMASSSESPKQPKIPETTQDMISSMPTEVTDKIMKRLPLKMAAKMSMLSRIWRRNWLSHRYLVFDKAFWEEHCKNGKFDWLKISKIISNILFFHNGAVQVFHLYIPEEVGGYEDMSLNISQWLSFLSRVGVKKICISNGSDRLLTIPSHIYACKELVKLRIEFYVLARLPCEFKGFAHLRNLELVNVKIQLLDKTINILIASCPRLTGLVIYVSGIQTCDLTKVLTVSSLVDVIKILGRTLVDGIKILAGSSELQCLQLGGKMCLRLAEGFRSAQPFTLAFKHLHRLCLTELDFSYFSTFGFTISMLQSCPFIKDLHISVDPNKSAVKHRFDYNKDYKLGHLLKVEITGIIGSSAEFQLIEYVLATSVVFEKLLFQCADLDPSSELKVSRELLQLPRASTKAKLVCLEQ